MKGKTKQEKGITLIALIITIVVLLILAVVTIGAIKNDSIISYADNSTEKYKDAQTKEEGILGYYESYLAGTAGTWTQEGITLTKINPDGTKTQIKIGDYVNYVEGNYTHTPDIDKGAGTTVEDKYSDTGTWIGAELTAEEIRTEDLNWRVLGVNENGQIELISVEETSQCLWLGAEKGYVYSEENLKNFCNDLYGKGTNNAGKKVAEGARSLTAEDINELTKYNPASHIYNGEQHYGYKYTYKFPTEEERNDSTNNFGWGWYYKIEKPDGTLVKDWEYASGADIFRFPGEETEYGNEKSENSVEVIDNWYEYFTSDNFSQSGYTDAEYEIIKSLFNANGQYWLNTKYTYCDHLGVTFGLMRMNWSSIDRAIPDLYSLDGITINNRMACVKPVVTLAATATLTDFDSETNMWQIAVK